MKQHAYGFNQPDGQLRTARLFCKSRGGIGLHLAMGIAIAFAFIVFMKITTVFATNGDLSPFMAVLLPQLIFGIAAGILIYKAPK